MQPVNVLRPHFLTSLLVLPMAQWTFKRGYYPGGPNLFTWVLKTREPSLTGGGRVHRREHGGLDDRTKWWRMCVASRSLEWLQLAAGQKNGDLSQKDLGSVNNPKVSWKQVRAQMVDNLILVLWDHSKEPSWAHVATDLWDKEWVLCSASVAQ